MITREQTIVTRNIRLATLYIVICIKKHTSTVGGMKLKVVIKRYIITQWRRIVSFFDVTLQ